MTSHTGLVRIGVILLFIITFTLIGWAAPAVYASYAPADHFIEVHGFEAQNTSTDAEQHLICFDRTMHRSTSGTAFTELYLVTDDGNRIEVGSDTMTRYFQDGRHRVVTPLELPNNLEEGTYRYVLVVRMEMVDGRVTRDFAYESEPFTVNGYTEVQSTKEFTCS